MGLLRRARRHVLSAAALIAALAVLPLASGASSSVSATLRKSTQGTVRIVFRNEGEATIVGFRQVLPDPFIVTGAKMDGASCTVRARDQYGCGGFSAAPGSTWAVVFDSPPVYSNETGTDVAYYPGGGPSTVFVSEASGAETGPIVAEWDSQDARQEPFVGLGIVRLETSPRRPRAGKRFVARLALSTSDLATLTRTGRVGCRAKAGGRTLRSAGSRISAGARAECAWVLPRASRGKQLRGRIEVRHAKAIVGRSFAVRIAA